MRDLVSIEHIVGMRFDSIDVSDNKERITFHSVDGNTFVMLHDQDCCEYVYVEDICGDLSDLIQTPIVYAECATSDTDPDDYQREYAPESVTWTFYHIRTIKGTVTIRWIGESNGYYSETVDLVDMTENADA